MAERDRSNHAPKGKYRVVGTDSFSWPHDDYWVGDCADLPHARKLANSHVQAMTPATVYDENGKLLFTAGIDELKI
jgi:hypothetical protein